MDTQQVAKCWSGVKTESTSAPATPPKVVLLQVRRLSSTLSHAYLEHEMQPLRRAPKLGREQRLGEDEADCGGQVARYGQREHCQDRQRFREISSDLSPHTTPHRAERERVM